MRKFEPIFSDMCFPVTANRKLYDVQACVQFLSRTEKAAIYKTYNPDTNHWEGCHNKDAKFGTYGVFSKSNRIFVNPVNNKSYEGDVIYIGKGIVSPRTDGTWDLRALLHGKDEADGLFKRLRKNSEKYIIYNFDWGLPEVVAYAEESFLIAWLKHVIKKTYNNSKKITDEIFLNNREEKSRLETVDYYLNIPELVCKLRNATEQNKSLILTK